MMKHTHFIGTVQHKHTTVVENSNETVKTCCQSIKIHFGSFAFFYWHIRFSFFALFTQQIIVWLAYFAKLNAIKIIVLDIKDNPVVVCLRCIVSICLTAAGMRVRFIGKSQQFWIFIVWMSTCNFCVLILSSKFTHTQNRMLAKKNTHSITKRNEHRRKKKLCK